MKPGFTDNDGSGFYHDPPLWVGSSPIDEETTELEDFDSLVEVVFQATLPCGVDIAVTREGLFVFGFNSWETAIGSSSTSSRTVTDDERAKSILTRSVFMNAFLALLYTHSLTNDRMIVTPELMLYIGFVDDPAHIISIPLARLELLTRSNEPGTYNPNWSPTDDYRIRRRIGIIRLSDLRASTDQMVNVMAAYPADGLLLLDLFLRASKAYQDYSYSSSLITYWAITEKLLGELWATYREDNKIRNGEPFITAQRLKRLQDSRTYSAAVVIEILSLASYLDYELYQDLCRIRKARNDWMHSLSANISRSDADAARQACECMFLKVRKLRIKGF